MKILDLTNKENSEIKYEPYKFPDGQQNLKITNMLLSFERPQPAVTIKSRFNNWLDLELIACAVACLRQLFVKEIHIYVPYIEGARSDRKFEEGGNNYLKEVICPIINLFKFESVSCLDPHSDVLEACLNGFIKETNLTLVSWATHEMGYHEKGAYKGLENAILISPDAGANKKIFKIAEQIGYTQDIITCSKDRGVDGKLSKTIVPLEVTLENYQKDLIIIDDICDGGATFINIAKSITDQFAAIAKGTNVTPGKLYLIVTHGIFSKGFGELSRYFDGIYCTNSYQNVPYGDYNDESTCKEKFVKQLNVF